MTSDYSRIALSELKGQNFDVVLIGGGVNGASVANHLAAEGYSTLVVEKGDFGSGASSRSSRLLHCGLAGLAPPDGSPWHFIFRPGRLREGMKSAREMAKAREEFARTMPERVRRFTFCYPIYKDGMYSGWQIDLGFAALKAVAGSSIPLNYLRYNREETLAHPVGRYLTRPEMLKGMATFTEYQFDFAERMVMDTLLAAGANGALYRNHTAVTQFRRQNGLWQVRLQDQLSPEAPAVQVQAKVLLNLTGAWIDDVNKLTPSPSREQLITRKLGMHVMVQLPPEMRDFGIFSFARGDEPLLYIVPWRGMHYIGPTDMGNYRDSLDHVATTEEQIGVALKNARGVIQGVNLSREDVIYSWAGVQPRTFVPGDDHGSWSRTFHKVGSDKEAPLYALTGATLGRSRMSGRDGLKLVQSLIPASGKVGRLEYGAHHRPGTGIAAHQRNIEDPLNLADITYAVEQEQARTIEDLMFRRTGQAWSDDMGRSQVEMAASEMGSLLGWSESRRQAETQAYLELLDKRHRAVAPR